MLRNHDGLARGLGLAQMRPQLGNRGHIQVAGRLVQQKHRGVGGPDAGKGDLLLLPARKLKQRPAQQGAEVQGVGGGLNPLAQGGAGQGAVLHPKGDLAVGIHVKKLGARVLEHRPHLPGQRVHRHGGGVKAVHGHAAPQLSGKKVGDQAVEQPCQGGFAAARPPAEQHTLAVRYGQR